MLKHIPPVLSPELMMALMKMGHGDEIVLADGNFPADSHARRIIRADGWGVIPLLEGILHFLPIDTFVDDVAVVMHPVAAEHANPPIWEDFRHALRAAEGKEIRLTEIERFAFYERSRNAYAIVATGETAIYGNIILKKGVVYPG
ncbi:MAG: fucose isomerase [Planctomycetota bacterium]|nr:fucose isomerase [Planctomycetota bacterium]MDA1213703.1 fucose isomerase [Planctomycetota bacterium]